LIEIRGLRQENIRFCYIARGSLEETLTYLVLAYEMGYIPKQLYEMLRKDGEDVVRLINGYITYLKKTRKGSNEPGANLSVKEESNAYEIDSMEESVKDYSPFSTLRSLGVYK
jgi:hypothetical protein